MDLSVRIVPFSDTCDFKLFFGTKNYSMNEEIIKDYIRLYITWEVLPSKIITESDLFYAPYLIVIPNTSNISYAGADYYGLDIQSVCSFPDEVLEFLTLKENSLNLADIHNRTDALFLRPKSFAQGFSSIAFHKSDKLNKALSFEVHLIYYDFKKKSGWIKSVSDN